METKILELLFSTNKDEITSGERKGEEKHDVWEESHLIQFEM